MQRRNGGVEREERRGGDKRQRSDSALLPCIPLLILSSETDQLLKQTRPLLAEYKEHLEALEQGESFTPKLTGNSKKKASFDEDEDQEMSNAEDDSPKRGTKRKSMGGAASRSAKRRRSNDEDDFIVDDDEDEELTFSDDDDSVAASEGEGSEGPEDSEFDENSGDENSDDEDNEGKVEEVTVETLQAKIQETQEAITLGRTQLSEFRRLRKEAVDAIATLKKREQKAQREKNAFCSKKRSEVRFIACPLVSRADY